MLIGGFDHVGMERNHLARRRAQRSSDRYLGLLTVAVALFASLTACTVPAYSIPTSVVRYGERGPATPMLGDPQFDRGQLNDAVRQAYDQLWLEIDDPSNHREVMELADSDDLFTYGRQLHGYIQAVLTVFRATGDLSLLDHVDVIAERMRARLDYGWRDTKTRSDGTDGEYLMWVFRYGSSTSLHGTDNRIDDLKTHALIAMVAYALELNRDLDSPSGREYGEHADFWRDYLVDHFETKLRSRFDQPGRSFPITTHSDGHTYYSWTKWHFYMGLLTGDESYLREAHRMADVIWANIRVTDTTRGLVYVWASNISEKSDARQYLMTTAYAHSVYGDIVTFHFEGFHNWASHDHLRAFARTVTEFVLDSDDVVSNGVTADIGGDARRAGIPAMSGRPRRTAEAFAGYQFALISPWDSTGRLANVSREVRSAYPSINTTRLAAGLVLDAQFSTSPSASTSTD